MAEDIFRELYQSCSQAKMHLKEQIFNTFAEYVASDSNITYSGEFLEIW